MARAGRRHSHDRDWVADLPDLFSMRDMTSLVTRDRVPRTLTWLYDAIERGRVEPSRHGGQLRYRFIGRRRADDGHLAEVVDLTARRTR
jgi:hypothetical protein